MNLPAIATHYRRRGYRCVVRGGVLWIGGRAWWC